ncbi:4-(cytidine 5'-diphospho)-2-C-methyl-D-erythritol kinase [Burkholderiaceae bacterium FT117]|uniref:4-(cytidine 5'-diphospho)-2-C-methyl-D-erythritol kinase n=1 Tax=Zeimonas sediminis TaxID=2944268 RepID=UPI00234301B2|nr:4-(cytidine 5'-diphospho)-2-C-methyl-D-erythritol kinase [Zeimonas sediminis]MCM5571785.1 4-(cytidine 5'-diphospho)-2-C-methyl-D-erythritol kinase [Zeimonas sediminis]
MIEELRNLPAPAKLNLFLHVTGRRNDGYHLLETVFDLIDVGDRLTLRVRNDGALIRRDSLPGVTPEQDLTVRAARLLAEETGCRLGVDIAIDKRIPMGAGLGGGSSDAATMLLGLNRLWDLRLTRRQLMRFALRLGADVPFFVFGRTAYATGIGEKLQALPLPPATYVVVAPPVPVSTAVVFSSTGLTRDTKPLTISGLSRESSARRGRNDLEPVVCAAYPAVASALAALKSAARQAGLNADSARMTGSGSCVFLPVPDESVATSIQQDLSRRRNGSAETVGEVFVARSLARHPLSDWAFVPGA